MSRGQRARTRAVQAAAEVLNDSVQIKTSTNQHGETRTGDAVPTEHIADLAEFLVSGRRVGVLEIWKDKP